MSGALASAAWLLLALSTAHADGDGDRDRLLRLFPLRIADEVTTRYDGIHDDLLTAGLGATGLKDGALTPTVSAVPTASELRRLAIFVNYRALVDVAPAGGYGLFWGPALAADGSPAPYDGKIAGDETLAFALQPDGSRVTLMVQVPASFDPAHACIVTAPSSGSRGIYGAIATAGEWGLKHGCAVAYTDKGSGTGFDDLQNSLVTTLQGVVTPIAQAGSDAQFVAPLSPSLRAAYDAAEPNRFAFKHAHSQVDPEAEWGQYVLQSVRYAFDVLGRKFHGRVERHNTIVIASSVSNGGGASLRAAEQDRSGLIDGVAVAEPNVNPAYARFGIQQGNQPVLADHGRKLIDYVTLQNLYDGCAIAADPSAFLFDLAGYYSPGRCQSLHAAGLLSGATLADQAAEAQAKLNAAGIMPEQNELEAIMWVAYVPQSIAVTYANSYGRFSVVDSLCRYSFAGVDSEGHPAPISSPAEATLFATSSGIPPIGGVSLINDAATPPKENRTSNDDQNLAGALCLRSLATGRDAVTGQRLPPLQAIQSARIAAGVAPIIATGDLGDTPAIIVTGRSDDILPPNHASRAYVGLNQLEQARRSQLRYIEVTNAQHLDSLLTNPGYGLQPKYLPLHRYFVQAMDLMYAHLRNRAPLPPSQVVHTVPRGPGAPQITAANVPPITNTPGADAITFTNRVLYIPQ